MSSARIRTILGLSASEGTRVSSQKAMLDMMEERRVEHMKGIWNIIYNKRNRY
jgi:hypothetical protein